MASRPVALSLRDARTLLRRRAGAYPDGWSRIPGGAAALVAGQRAAIALSRAIDRAERELRPGRWRKSPEGGAR